MTPLLQLLLTAPYAGLSDADAAAALNAPATANAPAPLNAVKLVLYQDATPCAMLRIAAQSAIADTTVAGLQLAAQTAAAYLNDPHVEHIDFSLTSVQSMLALLVAGGVISQALSTQIAALGSYSTTVAAAAGIVPNGVLVQAGDITYARAGL